MRDAAQRYRAGLRGLAQKMAISASLDVPGVVQALRITCNEKSILEDQT